MPLGIRHVIRAILPGAFHICLYYFIIRTRFITIVRLILSMVSVGILAVPPGNMAGPEEMSIVGSCLGLHEPI